MCDNTAVSWSEYESSRRNADHEMREKISKELLQTIEFLEWKGAPRSYIQGVEHARMTVLYGQRIRSMFADPEEQQKLF